MKEEDEKSNEESKIKVWVRIRPPMHSSVSSLGSQGNSIKIKKKTFTYDGVLPQTTNQFQCYKRIAEPLINSCLEGYNTTVMAYGQTGSGKTFTIGTSAGESSEDTKFSSDSYAPQSVDGLIPRFTSDLFHRTNALQGRKVDISVSFLEIYNEKIRDLLNPHDEEDLKIVERGRGKRGARVMGLSRHKVSCTKDVLKALSEGVARRVTCGTKMNTVSSRSHAIMILDLEIRPSGEEEDEEDEKNREKGDNEDHDDEKNHHQEEMIRSSVTFVDLAGSERLKRTGAIGQRKEEGIMINMGLLALGQVINALADEKRIRSGTHAAHVPYRDSNLTRLLQDALGGNSRTVFVACVSPCDEDCEETMGTLRYAYRARNISNCAVVNVDSKTQTIRRLRVERNIFMRDAIALKFANGTEHAYDDEHSMFQELLVRHSVISFIKTRLQEASKDPYVRKGKGALTGLTSDLFHAVQCASSSMSKNDMTTPLLKRQRLKIVNSMERSPVVSSIMNDTDETARDDEEEEEEKEEEEEEEEEEEDEEDPVPELMEYLLQIEQREAEQQVKDENDDAEQRQIDEAIEKKRQLMMVATERLREIEPLKKQVSDMAKQIERLQAERNRLSSRIEDTQVMKEEETTKALEEHRLNATLRVKLDRVISKLRRIKSEHKRQNDELNRQKDLTRHVSKLERNITSLKAAKVSLVKRRRQEEKQFKAWRKDSSRKIVSLRKQHRVEQRAVVKLSRESKRDRIVMDRQQGRLLAVTQRLKKTEKRLLCALKSKHRRHTSRLRVTRRRRIRRRKNDDDNNDEEHAQKDERKNESAMEGDSKTQRTERIDGLEELLLREANRRCAVKQTERELQSALERRVKVLRLLKSALSEREIRRDDRRLRKRMFMFMLCVSRKKYYDAVPVDEKKRNENVNTSSSPRRSSSNGDRSQTKIVASTDISSLDSDALDAFRRRETMCRSRNENVIAEKEDNFVPAPPAPTTQQRDSARGTMGFSPSPPPPPSQSSTSQDINEFERKHNEEDLTIWKCVSEFLNIRKSSKARRTLTSRPVVSVFRPVTPPVLSRHHSNRRNQHRTPLEHFYGDVEDQDQTVSTNVSRIYSDLLSNVPETVKGMIYRQHHTKPSTTEMRTLFTNLPDLDLRRTIEALETECVSVDAVVEENSSELKLLREAAQTGEETFASISNSDAKILLRSLVQSRSEMKIRWREKFQQQRNEIEELRSRLEEAERFATENHYHDISPATSPRSRHGRISPAECETADSEKLPNLRSIFDTFCGFGARRSAASLRSSSSKKSKFSSATKKQKMDNARFAKFAKDSELLGTNLSTTDVDMIFVQVKRRGQRRIDYSEFEKALREIAKKKGVSTDRLMALIHASGGPKSRHTTEARSPHLNN